MWAQGGVGGRSVPHYMVRSALRSYEGLLVVFISPWLFSLYSPLVHITLWPLQP